MRIIILTEGYQHTGYGHITRCQSIYQAFEEKGHHPLMIINGDDNARSILKNQKAIFFNWLDSKKQLFEKIQSADILIIDSYLADISIYNKIAEIVKMPVYIDDNMRLNYPKGVIINGSIGAENLPYPKEADKTYLLGTKYQPMRKAFWNIPKRTVNEKVEKVLITFGGTDTRNLTPKILKILVTDFPELQKNIVIGKGFNNIDEIEKLKDDQTFLHYNLDDEGMKNLMLQSDVAISAAGQTLYELAVTNTPTIAIGIADNQKNNIEGWFKKGFIEFAGWWNDKKLLIYFKAKLHILSNKNNRFKLNTLDKKSTLNTINKLLIYHQNENVIIRKAMISDIKNVFQLSNSLDVRSNSVNKNAIVWNEHVSWFTEKIKNTNCCYFVANEKETFVGQVRYDLKNTEAVVSISIKNSYRKRGLAAKLLKDTAYMLFQNKLKINIITALIKPNNFASVKLFKRVGYRFIKTIKKEHEQYLFYQLSENNICV